MDPLSQVMSAFIVYVRAVVGLSLTPGAAGPALPFRGTMTKVAILS